MRAKIQAAAAFCCRDGTRPHSLPIYLPASFVTAVADVATPGDSLLQEASAGQPNQQDQRRLPEEGLPFLTASAEWHGGGAPTRYERIAAIGDFGGGGGL
jgi:hypothetical protein